MGSASSDIDNATYEETVVSGTKEQLLAAISNPDNWNGNNSRISVLADGPFEVEGADQTGGSDTGSGSGAEGEFVPYSYDFETDLAANGWTVVSVDSDSDNTWSVGSYSGDQFADVNAYGDTAAANDWLISPLIDLSGNENPVVSFQNAKNFDDTSAADPEVKFLYSTDYSGSGNPEDATWTEVSYNSSNGNYAEVGSGDLDLSAVKGQQVYFAFQYTSSGTGNGSSSRWQIDDFSVRDGGDSNNGGGNGGNNGSEPTLISAIQGSGRESTMKGDTVTIEAIVTADFQSNSDSDYNGFFLQEEASDSDDDASTSEGLFVYEGGNSIDVKVGDKVKVTGTVTEFNGETQISLSNVEVIDGSASHLSEVAPAKIAFPSTNVVQNEDGQWVADLEAYEGMLVKVPEAMTVGDLYTLGRFNEVGLTSGGRIATYTQTNDPSVEGFAQFQKDAAARALVIDDAFEDAQHRDPIFPQNGGLSAQEPNILRAGDTVENLTGVLAYRGARSEGENFRLIPTEEPEFVSSNPRPEEAPDVGGTLKVASFNVLNFFTTLDAGGAKTGPADNMDPRGAETQNEYVRQLDKLASAMIKLGADIFGLTELENGQQGDSALDALIAKLNGLGETVYDYVKTGPIQGAMGDPVEGDAIKVGFIYNTGTVEAIGDYALLDETVDDRFQSVGTQRPTLAQTFEQKSGGEKITVAINHLKSKGTVVDGDEAIGDGQANNNHVRTEAAKALVDWLKNDPTGEGNGDNLIIGDLNSYLKEDPIKAIQAGADDTPGTDDDYTSLLSSDDYSYGFPISLDDVPQVQTFGSLDHALASASLATKVTGAATWHINADEASVLDYNTNYKSEEQQSDLYKNDPYRSSDHDPLIVGLDLSNSETPLNVSVYNGPSFDGQIVPTKNIELDSLSQTKLSGAEIAAYDAGSKQLLVTSSDGLQYLDISDPKVPSLTRTVDLKTVTDPSTGNNFTTTDITSVAAKNGIIAVALPAANKTDAGQVVFLDKDGAVLGSVTVGSVPDMVTFTPDGMKVLVANEGEPSKGFEVNPKGSVSIIDLSSGVDQVTVETADFTAFDGQENALRAEGVRIFEGQSVSDDVEPEYIAVTPDGTKALVTLQEANAVAIVDIESAAVTEIVPLGGKSFANLLTDFSDRDGAGGEEAINLTTDNPVIGQFMPDAISSYTAGDGKVYFVTANEGDDRDDFLPNEETIRLKNDDYKLDSDTYPNAGDLKNDADLGRLNVSNAALLNGDTDGDGDVDQILTYGARSFSILDANGKMIFDSGDAIERIVASEFPDLFDDGRSDNKGPEPEGVTVSEIGGRSYAFVGLERSNLSLVFDVTDPANVTYTTAATTQGDEAPEGTLVISADESPTGKALYISPNENSETLSIYEASVVGGGDTGGGTGGGDGVTGGGSDPVIDTGTDSGDVFENPTFPGSIDGGAGIDRVSLPNAYSDYVLTPTEGGFALALASDPSDMIDLSNVEVLQFGDLTLERNDSPEAATIYGLYGSIFGRTPDLTGISFWVGANESGVSLETVAEFFTQSAEFIATYGANPTDDALVDGFFGNILGRTGDAEGEAFWKAALDNGLSTADLLLGFAQSSEFVGLIDNQIDDGIFVIQ
ncbi:MAG: ExeM/NucH family extracellular endonuclease [Fulvimarina manganoxydans]|uniref:ExeM/NucH family extracellular endonuclease n=1 Tax=Fulvimarina manganoxydans TaxID=937218 RepID=UPI002356C7D4|nr:ExeM/NucH family extracellular endonuclease [Fulvimarina manganoxydans]MCK5930676.1 ExeM/NucH family extracellular endonuclease [Fulvimarina manganoxydans]